MNAAAALPSAGLPSTSKPSLSRRLARFLVKPALLLLSLAFALGLLEIGMRVLNLRPQTATVLSTFFEYDDQTGWRGKPEVASRFATMNFDVSVSHDAAGYRRSGYDRPIETDGASKDRIAWVLGDSGTWGWGVADGKTYVDLLNQMADDRSADDKTHYRNLGHCGFSSVQQYLLVKKLFASGTKPDEVVVLFCENDLRENLDARDQIPARAYLEVDGDRAELKNHPTPQTGGWGLNVWLKNHSLVWNHAHFYAMRAKNRWRARQLAPVDVAARTARPAIVATPEQTVGLTYAYRLLRDLCRENDVALRIVNDGSAVVPEVCRALDIACVDPEWRFREHRATADAAPLHFGTDPHYNELGHKLLAEGLHADLKKLRATSVTAKGDTKSVAAQPRDVKAR